MRATLQSPDSRPAAEFETTREILLIAVFVLFSSVSYFLIEYDRLRSVGVELEAWVNGILAGIVPAPVQYRVALPYLAHFFEAHCRLRPNQSLPGIEAVAYACALTLLYLLFRGSQQVQNSGGLRRLVILGLFLAAAQFPVLWIFPWDRPETLPGTLYLTAMIFLISSRSRMPYLALCGLTVLLSLGQALVRADLPVIVGAALLLSAAIAIPFPISRIRVATLGMLCSVAGGATQVYLQRIAFPAARYPADTPKIQLLTNLNPFDAPIHIPEFLCALLPLIVTLLLWRRCKVAIDSSDKLVLLMCLLYLPVWVTTGLMAEVRIFVPFLFLASPTIAKIWAAFLLNEDSDAFGSAA